MGISERTICPACTNQWKGLARASEILDRDHYGLAKVKRRLIEYFPVRKLNPAGRGPILWFLGPPGVGKTSLSATRFCTRHWSQRSVRRKAMEAMLFGTPGGPLVPREVPAPRPGAGEVLVKVTACAICRTDLHVLDGDLAHRELSLIPGHEIVGAVESWGAEVSGFHVGLRVGVPWLGWTCGACGYCRSGRENLCGAAKFTGYSLDRGLRRVHRSQRPVLLPPARWRGRRLHGTAPLRQPHWIPFAAQDGQTDLALQPTLSSRLHEIREETSSPSRVQVTGQHRNTPCGSVRCGQAAQWCGSTGSPKGRDTMMDRPSLWGTPVRRTSFLATRGGRWA